MKLSMGDVQSCYLSGLIMGSIIDYGDRRVLCKVMWGALFKTYISKGWADGVVSVSCILHYGISMQTIGVSICVSAGNHCSTTKGRGRLVKGWIESYSAAS